MGSDLDTLIFRAWHDVKTPMVAIAGLTQVLKRQLSGQLDPVQRALFDRIEANVDLLSARLEDIIEVARAAAAPGDPSEGL